MSNQFEEEHEDWFKYESVVKNNLKPYSHADRVEKLLWLILKYVWHRWKKGEK